MQSGVMNEVLRNRNAVQRGFLIELVLSLCARSFLRARRPEECIGRWMGANELWIFTPKERDSDV